MDFVMYTEYDMYCPSNDLVLVQDILFSLDSAYC